MEKFKNKVVWITGASSGFGEALAKCFAAEGAEIILSGRNREAIEKVQSQISGSKSVIFEMEDTAVFQEKTKEAIATFGNIDIIIHNAAISQNSTVMEVRPDVEQKIMRIDYLSPVELTKCILPHFLKRKSGTIVVVSGMLAYLNFPLKSTYAASKAALIAYFGCLRAEVRPYNINVNTLVSGSMKTELANKAIAADGNITEKRKEIQGCSVEDAARQAVNAIYKQKPQSFVGNKKEFFMLKLWGMFPNFIINKILKMNSK